MNAFQLYRRYIGTSLRAQMQYPGSFVMMAGGEFIATFTEFVGVWVLFRRFGEIRGWTFAEIALFYGTIHVSFAIADAISRGFDVFGPQFVKTGNFDRILVRPRSTILQLLGYELRLARIGRLAQGAIVMAIATHLLGIEWDARKVALLAAAIAGGIALFVGILILQATLAFWTIESLEIANTLTYGGVEAAQYPLDIYSRWFRNFLIFVVPIGCVAYFPIVRILGHRAPLSAPGWMLDAAPLSGIIFLLIALRVWRLGVQHYTSTGT